VSEIALDKPWRQSSGGGSEAGAFEKGTTGNLKCVGHGGIEVAPGSSVKVKSGC
jgi:hypothetical protein